MARGKPADYIANTRLSGWKDEAHTGMVVLAEPGERCGKVDPKSLDWLEADNLITYDPVSKKDKKTKSAEEKPADEAPTPAEE